MVKMKEKRLVSISNQLLKRIAQNFRNVLFEAIKSKIKNLKDSGNYGQANVLQEVYNDSILKCATCSTLERDRVFNPTWGAWLCPQCWEINKKVSISMMEKKRRGENLGDYRIEKMKDFIE